MREARSAQSSELQTHRRFVGPHRLKRAAVARGQEHRTSLQNSSSERCSARLCGSLLDRAGAAAKNEWLGHLDRAGSSSEAQHILGHDQPLGSRGGLQRSRKLRLPPPVRKGSSGCLGAGGPPPTACSDKPEALPPTESRTPHRCGAFWRKRPHTATGTWHKACFQREISLRPAPHNSPLAPLDDLSPLRGHARAIDKTFHARCSHSASS